jgi:hypothetical protein
MNNLRLKITMNNNDLDIFTQFESEYYVYSRSILYANCILETLYDDRLKNLKKGKDMITDKFQTMVISKYIEYLQKDKIRISIDDNQ